MTSVNDVHNAVDNVDDDLATRRETLSVDDDGGATVDVDARALRETVPENRRHRHGDKGDMADPLNPPAAGDDRRPLEKKRNDDHRHHDPNGRPFGS